MGHQGHRRFGIIRWWRALLLLHWSCLVWGHRVSHWGNHKSKVVVYVPPRPESFGCLWSTFETGTSLGFVTFHKSSETPVELTWKQPDKHTRSGIRYSNTFTVQSIMCYSKSENTVYCMCIWKVTCTISLSLSDLISYDLTATFISVPAFHNSLASLVSHFLLATRISPLTTTGHRQQL